MADLGLFEAWRMWLDNVQVNQHTLAGWSILGLGRAGKVLSFVAGLTVILDIADPARLSSLATWLRRRRDSGDFPLYVLIFGGWWFVLAGILPDWDLGIAGTIFTNMIIGLLGAIVGAYVAVFVWLGGRRLLSWLVLGVAAWLAHPQVAQLRLLAIFALLLGFHFDLLAS